MCYKIFLIYSTIWKLLYFKIITEVYIQSKIAIYIYENSNAQIFLNTYNLCRDILKNTIQ
jgi:hypothetical protein